MAVPERMCGGECRGGTPSAIIRSDGMYVARTKSRLRFLPCGVSARSPNGATGNTVGGFRRGDASPPYERSSAIAVSSSARNSRLSTLSTSSISFAPS